MSGSSRLRTHQRFLSRRVKSEDSSAKAKFMLLCVHSPPPIRGWPVCLQRTLLLMEAEYKVCGITGLWADCCVLFVVFHPPAGKSKVQIYKPLKSNKESTAATLRASVFWVFFCVFVCLVGFFTLLPFPVNSASLFWPTYQPISIQQTHMSSASSNMQLGFWRTAWEHDCDGRKALSSRCPNRNVYADGHIYRNIN